MENGRWKEETGKIVEKRMKAGKGEGMVEGEVGKAEEKDGGC